MDRPAEVRYLELSSEAQEEVLWLDVSVNDFLLMTVLQGICQLLHELCEMDKK